MSIALRGYYEACCAVVAAPVDQVAAMLDPRLVVLDSEQTLAPPGQHPFVILMGAHRDVEVKFVPGKWNYREALVAVPWVRRRGEACGPDPLAYNERLWLDQPLVVVGGWFWGFPKRWSRVSMRAAAGSGNRFDAYSVRSLLGGHRVIEAQFKDRGAVGAPESFANFPAVRPIFEQMFLQRFLLIGPAILSNLTFELDRATVQAIDAEIVFKGQDYSVPGLDETPLGAFRLSLPWTLSWPFSCGSVASSSPLPRERESTPRNSNQPDEIFEHERGTE